VGRMPLHRASSRGQTLIEFALIAPIIFILLFGIIDFGMALDRRITLQHAVREGARYAAVTTDCAAIQGRTESQARDTITADEVGVRYYKVDGSTLTNPAAAGDVVKVSAPFEWEFPLMSRFGVGSIDIGVSGAARLELAVPAAGGCGP